MDINVIGAGNNDVGTPIYSSGNGTVVQVDPTQGLVQIENSEMGNYYGHMVKMARNISTNSILLIFTLILYMNCY